MENPAFASGTALKTLVLVLGLWLLFGTINARIVINELYYDHPGVDSGYEWIELYNAGDQDQNLEGCRLLKAGNTFTEVYVFPRYILRSGRYLLIGESLVPNAQLSATLAFQNGGGATDGVRFESADGLYTDTLLYDKPNGNLLPDDTGLAGLSFAPNAPPGSSLARITDGWDADDCALDWIVEANPTPGASNHIRLDFALSSPILWQNGSSWICGVWVKNLCVAASQVQPTLQFLVDEILVTSIAVGEISPLDSLYLECPLPVSDTEDHLIGLFLDFPSDPNQENNQFNFNMLGGSGKPRINEVMYRPAPGYQEWMEIWQDIPQAGSYKIKDRAGGNISFTLPRRRGYFVLCTNSAQMQSRYPDCPAENIIQLKSWTALNNDGDTLWLLDGESAVIDSMSYRENASPGDYSLERYESGGNSLWRTSLAAAGATPGLPNSSPVDIPPHQKSAVAVYGSPCKAKAGETISVAYQLPQDQNHISCKVWSRAGHLVKVLAADTLVPATGVLIWDGRDLQGRYVSRGLYYIQWHSRGMGSSRELNRRFSVAIRD